MRLGISSGDCFLGFGFYSFVFGAAHRAVACVRPQTHAVIAAEGASPPAVATGATVWGPQFVHRFLLGQAKRTDTKTERTLPPMRSQDSKGERGIRRSSSSS
jgi:hypothetical protein